MWWISLAWAADWAVMPHLGTDVPLHVGAGVDVETPFRLRAGASVGLMPGPYLDLTNAVVTELFPASYPPELAALVDSTLSSSVVVRTRLGWRPFQKHGWHFGAGFTVATLGGDATGPEVIAALTGVAVPEERDPNLVIDAASTVGFVDVGTGWDIPVWRQLFIRPAIGWSFAMTANTRLTPSADPRTPVAQQALDELVVAGEVLLDDTLTGYVHPPWIGLSVGWRFDVGGR